MLKLLIEQSVSRAVIVILECYRIDYVYSSVVQFHVHIRDMLEFSCNKFELQLLFPAAVISINIIKTILRFQPHHCTIIHLTYHSAIIGYHFIFSNKVYILQTAVDRLTNQKYRVGRSHLVDSC